MERFFIMDEYQANFNWDKLNNSKYRYKKVMTGGW